jgi:hypothetical protein
MTAIMTERTARKEHRCNRCRQSIRPGSRYRDWALPPGEPDGLGRPGWLRERVHLTYAECGYPCEIRCSLLLDEAHGGLCCVCEALEPREVP